MVKTPQATKCDALRLVPPGHHDKKDITEELIHAANKANIHNVCMISSAGCDYAEAKKQPRKRTSTATNTGSTRSLLLTAQILSQASAGKQHVYTIAS
ncbi:hypothetical protein PG984_010271 [Apiospora sp. TS-2023a]